MFLSAFSENLSAHAFLCHVFIGSGQHQLNTVHLVDFTGAWIIVDSHNVGLRILAAQLFNDAFSNNVIGQTAKWLSADNIWRALVDQLDHLTGQKPSLTGLISKGDNRLGVFGQILDHRLLTEMFAGAKLQAGSFADGLKKLDADVADQSCLFRFSKKSRA